MTVRIQLRADIGGATSSYNWLGNLPVPLTSVSYWTQSINPVLAAGELGVVSSSPVGIKIGDGTTAWSSRMYAQGVQGTGSNGIQGFTGDAGSAGFQGTNYGGGAPLQNYSRLQAPTSPYWISNADLNGMILASQGTSSPGAQYIQIQSGINGMTSWTPGKFVRVYNSDSYEQSNVIIQGTSGVTVQSAGGTQSAPKIRFQGAATIVNVGTDRWLVYGDIV